MTIAILVTSITYQNLGHDLRKHSSILQCIPQIVPSKNHYIKTTPTNPKSPVPLSRFLDTPPLILIIYYNPSRVLPHTPHPSNPSSFYQHPIIVTHHHHHHHIFQTHAHVQNGIKWNVGSVTLIVCYKWLEKSNFMLCGFLCRRQ